MLRFVTVSGVLFGIFAGVPTFAEPAPMWTGHGLLQKWLWHPQVKDEHAQIFFRREIEAPADAKGAVIEITADNSYVLYVNGKKIGSGDDFNVPQRYDLKMNGDIQPGRNIIAVEAKNTGGPGGLVCGIATYGPTGRNQLAADGWLCSAKEEAGWNQAAFETKGWVPASVIADFGTPPWLQKSGNSKSDTYAAFRTHFAHIDGADIEFRFLGATSYLVWLDGELLAEGPPRFPKSNPEYDIYRGIPIKAGPHVLAAQVHYEGVTTRILADIPPFLACEILENGQPIKVDWKCMQLPGYRREVRRLNPELGWIEWVDTRQIPWDWRQSDFDDSSWDPPVPCDPGLGPMKPLSSAPVKLVFEGPLEPTAQGKLAETYGYEFDDIPARFMLRDLDDKRFPAQGVWRRYALDRVHTGRPKIELDVPAGTVIEMAYNENLMYGRVSPYITLSAGPSCHLDHFIARGGKQTFYPFTAHGMRYFEVHVLADPDKVKFTRVDFIESAYNLLPQGSFTCNDELLNRIWHTGVNTYRASTRDALVDSIREQGQWTGDVVSSGMDIAASAYGDIRLIRRAIMQSSQCARADGMVAGLCPGGCEYLPTYSAQWTQAVLHYYELTGDKDLLVEMYPSALKNFKAFEAKLTPEGLGEGLGWVFIDWGYVPNPGPMDIAYNLHFLAALRDMKRWDQILDKQDDLNLRTSQEKALAAVIAKWFENQLQSGGDAWQKIGYHRAALGLRLGFFDGARKTECIAAMKKHILNCFPNNPDAPRLSDPNVQSTQLITPYFANYAFPPLIESGEIDFVLDQYRKCWGWPLQEGLTTWSEVFDLRWSHCHCWSGCPTWQLSRYALGLHPRFDLGRNHYVLNLIPGNLKEAAGKLPIAGTEKVIEIRWQEAQGGHIQYQLKTQEKVFIHLSEKADQVVEVEQTFNSRLKSDSGKYVIE